MKFYCGVIWEKKTITDSKNKPLDVFRVKNVALATSSKNSNRFYDGPYAGSEVINISCCKTSDKLVSSLIPIDKLLEATGLDSVNMCFREFFNAIKDSYYYYIPEQLEEIKDSYLLDKCIDVFESNDNVNRFEYSSDLKDNLLSSYNIEEKYKMLKEHIYGQDEALKIFLSCMIKNRSLIDLYLPDDMISLMKSNILLIGSTGVGKTMMVKHIAKLLNIPYVIEDATRYTRSGFKGEDIENMLLNLYRKSEENLDMAERGILFIDEFDKLCNINDEDKAISTTDVQQSLLKIIEGTKVYISKVNAMDVGGFEFDTNKLTVVLSGAFSGIEKIVDKRCSVNSVGFKVENEDVKSEERKILDEDLENFGVIPELIGRISNTIELRSPEREDLKHALLYSKSSVLLLWEKYLKENGLILEFDEEFIDDIVSDTLELNTGYRGLNKCLNSEIEKQQYDLMTGKKKVLSLTGYKVTKKDS